MTSSQFFLTSTRLAFQKKAAICWAIFFVLLIRVPTVVVAQPSIGDTTYQTQHDSLKRLMYDFNYKTELKDRSSANYKFIKLLVETLKHPNSFQYSFDSLKAVSIQQPEDKTFRLFSWQVQQEKGSVRHYGCIQFNSKDLALIPLVDRSDSLLNPEKMVLKNGDWFGCVYYQIHQEKYKGKNHYMLIGWDTHEPFSTRRLVDVLTFDENRKPVFGAPIFLVSPKETKQRLIYEYSEDASMHLRYSPKDKLIIADHLIPRNPANEGMYYDYVPDLTYDAWQWKKGKWVFKNNVLVGEGKPKPVMKPQN